ncbi:MAG: hypothetical protein M0P50_07405 [Bacteroidales bacterium]|nr:hypothetical protein [Bacteroidales bacterium]
MLAEFSFVRHPVVKLLRYGHLLVPGVERVDVVYYDEQQQQLAGRTTRTGLELPYGEPMDISCCTVAMEKLRKGRAPFEWLQKEALPWIDVDTENISNDLLSELQKLVLMIAVGNPDLRPGSDLVFFYFRPDFSNLGMTTSTKTVTMREKDLVGRAYAASVAALIAEAHDDKFMWDDFEQAFKANGAIIENLRSQLKQMRGMYRERLVDSCRFYLKNLSEQYQRNYQFSAGALEQIRRYEGEYFRLENAIKAGVRIANNLHPAGGQEVTEIPEFFLNFHTLQRQEEIHDVHLNSNLEKPFNYLNIIENIVTDLRKNNIPLTAKNVAESMNPPVKHSAIKMYLNSNYDKILKLFNFYTDKWPLLRTEFKPTYNLLQNSLNRPHQRQNIS